jgi:predicted nuclease with TOPRIM domain
MISNSIKVVNQALKKISDRFKRIEQQLKQHEEKFSNQYGVTQDLIKRVAELERGQSDLRAPERLRSASEATHPVNRKAG